jgi:hypothetical protein
MIKYDVYRGVRKIKSKTQKTLSALSIGFAGLVTAVSVSLAPAVAAPSAIYNNIPSPTPGNLPSEAFEAQTVSEFGGQVQFAGTERSNPTVTVLMSSWGCQTGHWNTADCSTTSGATFAEDITLNIYNVNPDNSPGTVVKSVTQTFNIPFRPSADNTNCTGANAGKWFDGTTCYNGYATPVVFNLNGQGVTLPNKAIISVAYNTSHFGYHPYAENTECYGVAGGCGYDSLNVAVNGSPTAGSDPLPSDAYLYAHITGGTGYCSAGAVDTFRLDTGCWTGNQPAIKVEVNIPSKDDCKNNGWKTMSNPGPFKNQGDCVSFYATNGKNQPAGH